MINNHGVAILESAVSTITTEQVRKINDLILNDEIGTNADLIAQLADEGVPFCFAIKAVTVLAPKVRTNPRSQIFLVNGDLVVDEIKYKNACGL